MIIFKIIGFILLSLVIYNFINVELHNNGIDISKEDFYKYSNQIITKINEIDINQYSSIIIPISLLLILMC